MNQEAIRIERESKVGMGEEIGIIYLDSWTW
jgi:hypothetical protein